MNGMIRSVYHVQHRRQNGEGLPILEGAGVGMAEGVGVEV